MYIISWKLVAHISSQYGCHYTGLTAFVIKIYDMFVLALFLTIIPDIGARAQGTIIS